MKALFIGGIADGQRRQVPQDMPFCQVEKPSDDGALLALNDDGEVKPAKMDRDIYIRSQLDDGEKRFTIYALDGLNVVRELINGYRNPLKEESSIIVP